jgi:hypothetical protein
MRLDTITETELAAINIPAIHGIKMIWDGVKYNTPAAIGMPRRL